MSENTGRPNNPSKIDFGQFKPRRAKRSKSVAPFVVGGLAVAMLVVALIVGAVKFGGDATQQVGSGDKPAADTGDAGTAPSNGLIKDWFAEHAHDSDIQYVKWYAPYIHTDSETGRKSWLLIVRWRGKNRFGALTLSESTFEIRGGKVVGVEHDD